MKLNESNSKAVKIRELCDRINYVGLISYNYSNVHKTLKCANIDSVALKITSQIKLFFPCQHFQFLPCPLLPGFWSLSQLYSPGKDMFVALLVFHRIQMHLCILKAIGEVTDIITGIIHCPQLK